MSDIILHPHKKKTIYLRIFSCSSIGKLIRGLIISWQTTHLHAWQSVGSKKRPAFNEFSCSSSTSTSNFGTVIASRFCSNSLRCSFSHSLITWRMSMAIQPVLFRIVVKLVHTRLFSFSSESFGFFFEELADSIFATICVHTSADETFLHNRNRNPDNILRLRTWCHWIWGWRICVGIDSTLPKSSM